MDRQLIKSLIDALAASDLSELEYTANGATLRLVKGAPGSTTGRAASAPVSNPGVDPAPAPLPRSASLPGAPDGLVRSPAFGVVHLQRSPGTPPLVTAGEAVTAGQVLCLIEAMKVFTELPAPCAGVMDAVLVESGQEVEAGQPLFRMEA